MSSRAHSQSSQESWTSFKGSNKRTGTSNSAFLRKPSFIGMMNLGPILSSPVSDNDSVYVGTITGRIYCIERENLGVKWHINVTNPVVSTPSVYKNHLIVATFSDWVYEPAAEREPSSVSSFNVLDAMENWKFELRTGVFSSICSVKGLHIFGCLDGKIYALNNEGNLNWQFATEGEVWCSPSSDGQTIFVGSDDCHIYALDLDGKMMWKTKLDGKIRSSSPCLPNRDNDIGFPSFYIGTYTGSLYRINKDSGAILWSSNLGSPLLSSPSSIEGYVLIGSSDGHLHCVKSHDGTPMWKTRTEGKVWSSPLLTRGLKVFFGSLDSHIYYLDVPTGQLLWKFPTMGMIDSSPCVVEGKLLVGSRDGYLYFFEQGDMISYIS